jgi:hypothetical protein
MIPFGEYAPSPISTQTTTKCPQCEGNGRCTWCRGSGRHQYPLPKESCPVCSGSGACVNLLWLGEALSE